MTIDGNLALHIQNGGCPFVHPNGAWFCQGRAGHELLPPLLAAPHYARVFSKKSGYEAVSWS